MDVAYLVAKLIRQMDPNPYTGRPPSVQDIVDVVRIGYGDDEARMVRITVH